MTRPLTMLIFTSMILACSPSHPLVGKWEVLSGRAGVEQLSAQEAASMTWIFSDDYTATFIEGRDTTRFRYRIDMERDPVWLDLTVVDSDAPVYKWEGIIEFSGDTLHLMAIEAGEGDRPTAGSLNNRWSRFLDNADKTISLVLRRLP